jgi:type IV pilus assembly protein PilY1
MQCISTLSTRRHEVRRWGRSQWATLATSLVALGGLLGTAAHASTSIAELPLKASVIAKPNVIFAMDDSGSMDWELMINGTFQGVFYANYWNANLYPGDTLRTGAQSADWPLYYLFPNGTGAGNRVYGDPDTRYGHAVPPTPQMAWTRSPAFNTIYYDTMRTYRHWSPGHVSNALTSFANADPSAARSHPVNGSSTMALNAVLNSNSTNWRFTFVAGMTIPTGASNIQCLWAAAPAALPSTVTTAQGFCTAQVPYYPATFWHLDPNCNLADSNNCVQAWNGQRLRRYEIRDGNTFPSGRSFVDEMQNFANWFTYYRKRRLLLGAAMGQVLENLSGLRMGVVAFNNRVPPTMWDADAVASSQNRLAAVGRFYTAEGDGGTPTHATMSYIHNQFDTNTNIIQFACQRNAQFIITDGFANDSPTAPLPYSQTTYGATAPYQAIAANSLHDKALSAFTYRLRATNPGALTAGRVPVGSAAVQNPDLNPNLHINTYALTLGMRGTIWPSATNPFVTAPTWPTPVGNTATMIDDLWHATINGRGQMYLATTPEETRANMEAGLLDIIQQSGAQSGVAVATVNLVRGDDRAYFGLYDPAGWKGDVVARPISQDTAVVGSTEAWSASALLLDRSWSSRVIATQKADGKGTSFTAANPEVGPLVNPSNKYGATTEVISYLRGDRTHEGTKFRPRTGLMGAIINSEPVVDRAEKVLYVASGEGMLHAFDTAAGSGQGQELWAFVPRAVLADIGQTVQRAYTFKTQLDGSPVLGTISGNKKILVAGMGAAGRSYYALDVTNPRGLSETDLAGKVMWEFPAASDTVTQAKVGQTLGRPVIAHSPDNGWVVLVTSGYNNTHDGKGRLWMLDANEGTVIHEFEVPAGTLSSESGLAHVVAFDDGTGKSRYVYGGDLLGNVWRFDLKDKNAPLRVAELRGPTNEIQPVTAPLELTTITTKTASYRALIVPTGRMLDYTDFGKAELRRQSIYVIKDDGVTLTTPRATLKQQVYTQSPEALTGPDVNWDTDRGWFVDLPVDEQANTRPSIVYGGVAVVTNKTGATDCAASSRLYLFDVRSGKKYPGATFIGTDISTTNNANAVTPVITKDGKVRFVVQDFEGKTPTPSSAAPPAVLPGKAGWREIRRQ